MQSSWTHPGRRMVDGTIRGFLAEALLPLTGLITAVFLTRRLGPADYGLFTLAAVVIAWVEGGIVAAFARPTSKFIAEAEDWRPMGATVVQLHLAVSGCVMILLWLLAAPSPACATSRCWPLICDSLPLISPFSA